MSSPEHLTILAEGVAAWNKWRRENPEISPDLSRANLSRFNLTGINLTGAAFGGANLNLADFSLAVLSGANFSKADLTKAELFAANLSQAKLLCTNLNMADLTGADLTGADFNGSYLGGTILNRARLFGADLSNTVFVGTVLGMVDLSEIRGLESAEHYGPSTIGIDTFVRSQGKIPKRFLRGAGVPDIFIKDAASLARQPIEFYSCSISYSSKDDDLAQRLYADLQAKNVRCWFAPEDLKIGDRFRIKIDRAIRIHDKLLLLLSANSMSSDWVEKEVETGFDRERRDKRTILFPIRLDDAIKKAEEGWAADIRRTRHIGDFTKWKDHDAYKKAFDRLLRDLKADKAPVPTTTKLYDVKPL